MKKTTAPDMFQHFLETVAGKGARAYINDKNRLILMPKDTLVFLDDEHKAPIRTYEDFFAARGKAENWGSCYNRMLNSSKPACN